MRVNVYSQELITETTGHPQVSEVLKVSDTGISYSAVRLYLHSTDRLHQMGDDDDRSAITFWLPRSPERREIFAKQLEFMAMFVRAAPPERGAD